MEFKTDTWKCVKCRASLVLPSHSKIWEKQGFVHVFTFQCQDCGEKYESAGGTLKPIRVGRDEISETEAIVEVERIVAFGRVCPDCGGPTTQGGAGQVCNWCYKEYKIVNGELTPSFPPPKPKPAMRQFYAVQ
jgi:hypothetical protein